MRLITWIACVLALAWPAAAGQAGSDEAQVTAGLQSGVIKLGDRTSIVVSIERTGSRAPAGGSPLGDLPDVDGLAIGPASGPQTSSFQSIVGRRVTSTVSQRWVIPVRPARAGEFEIPPFVVSVDDKRYQTPRMLLKVVEDMRGAELGFLEVRPSTDTVIEGQPFTVEVSFGWDEALTNVNFVDLSLGFWDGFPGTIEIESEFPAPGARRIERGVSVNGGPDVVVEELDPIEIRGRTFRRLRLLRSYLPTRGGRLDLPESYLNFGRAEERGSFFDRRKVKVDDYYVGAPKAYVEVAALPEEGRPLDFSGAVGEITARADVDRRDVDQGESIKLSVEWRGTGNFEFFDAPELDRMDAFDGFRVYGKTEEKGFDRRKTVYDLAPVDASVEVIPAVPLWVFDASKREYVAVETEPIPIRVRALEGAVDVEVEEEREFARDLRDIDGAGLQDGGLGAGAGASPPRWLVLAGLVGLPLIALCVRLVARRRGDPSAPAERRRRAARRALARALAKAQGPDEELRALYDFLAARSGEAEEAWVGRDVAARLSVGGATAWRNGKRVERETGEELARTIARLETAVWSGADGAGGASGASKDVLALADRLIQEGL